MLGSGMSRHIQIKIEEKNELLCVLETIYTFCFFLTLRLRIIFRLFSIFFSHIFSRFQSTPHQLFETKPINVTIPFCILNVN